MDFVINTGHRPQRQPITPNTAGFNLLTAIKNREGLARVRSLVLEGADIFSVSDGYWTPLTLAAHLGRTDIVHFLLDCMRQSQGESSNSSPHQGKWRCSVDSVNDGGLTPLLCAAKEGHADICRMLLEAGADVNYRNQLSGQTPLLVAIDNKQEKAVKVLLDYGADVQLTDNVGITPLYAAVNGDHLGIVQQLINAGCDVNIGSQDHAPVFIAARRGYLPILQVLRDAGCNIDVPNKYGVTPVYEAALKGNNAILEDLLDRGCDVNVPDMYSVSPLLAATMAGNRDGVEMLLNAGAWLQWRDSQGRCAVQLAIETGKASILELFLQRGVNISKRPHLTQREHTLLLELLLTSGLKQPPNMLLQRSVITSTYYSPQCRQWLNDFHTQPRSLKCLARGVIRRSLGNTILYGVPQLPIPSFLKDFVTFADSSTSSSCVLT
ncbi:hypothetical protein BaRGS_00032169 [Batillaria attramentaria]|uniref:SOCS box domain-containing protein n=1 Tax=Batillaria attramentaria TaxID=370345 RepID=A0ABD0JPK9_9CAEN